MTTDYTDAFLFLTPEQRAQMIKISFGNEANYIEYMKQYDKRYMDTVNSYADISFATFEDRFELNMDDAISALQSLGYKKKDAETAANTARNSGASTVEDVVKKAISKTSSTVKAKIQNDPVIADAVNGLITLGYKRRESEKYVKELYHSGIRTVEQIIKECLAKNRVS